MQIKFYSHPEKFMDQHLSETMRHGENSVSHLPPKFSQNEGFKLLVKICCICHDFGKFTTFFQQYLLQKQKSGSKHNHGFISALFTAFQVKNSSLNVLMQIDQYLPLIAYLCILHHHGNLGNLDEDIIRKGNLDNINQLETRRAIDLRNTEDQIFDLLKNRSAIEEIYRKIYPDQVFAIEEFSKSWKDMLKDLDTARHVFENRENDETKRFVFIYLLLLYSIIIDSDKKSAGELDILPERKILPISLVDTYKKCHFTQSQMQESINKIREEIYQKVNNAIENIDLEKHIITLTSPTGTGKTLSVFSSALKLRDKIEKQKGYTPRIIYSLPFTSIIDQNYEVIKDVLSSLQEYCKSPQEYLLKHHYLSNIEFKKDDEELESKDAEILLESWETEIVVTTFIQLLQTVIGFRNKYLKKYYKLAGSIILLDEVQNIPAEYWQIVSNTLKLICKVLGCYIILLTATRPLLFDEKECIELLQDHERYFQSFHRTRIIADIKAISLDNLIEKFMELYDESLSFLIVTNTIKSSITIYQRINELKKNGFIFVPIYYLSSNIVHKYRKQRIDEISSALKSGEKPILISTQVIEAGVDLDFDRVIRDLGPVDSIVQVAGRCNRSWKRSTSEVYVFNVIDDQGKSLASYVYGALSVNAVKSALSEGIFNEEKYYELVDLFFKNIKTKESELRSNELWKAMTNLRFYADEQPMSVSDFALIESLPNMADVFIQADEHAVDLWEYYKNEVLKERDFKTRVANFAKIKSEFYSYIISVPKNLSQGLSAIDRTERFYLLPYEGLTDFYDENTGFKRIPEDKTWTY